MSIIPLLEEIPYSELKKDLKTGDLIMFMGFDFTGALIMGLEIAEGTDLYTHVGMVVEMPPKGDIPGGLYYWQAMPPNCTTLFGPDYFKGVECNGCVLVSLDAVMKWVEGQESSWTSKIQLLSRSLINTKNPPNQQLGPAEEALLLKYMKHIGGRSFSSPTGTGMAEDYNAGLKSADKINGKSSSDATFFCSKLISQTLQKAGIFADNLITNSVLPGDFGSGQDNKKLYYQLGYGYDKEVLFKAD